MNVVCSPTRAVRFVASLAAVMGLSVVPSTVLAQTTVTLSAPGSHINADVMIQGGAAGWTDFSYSDTLATKMSSESYTRRIMMKFDTQNYIPANAVIHSAVLYLTLKSAESGEQRPLTAYWVNRSFVTGATNWYYYRPGEAWSGAGGDLGPEFGTTYVGSGVGSAYAFDLTTMVQRIVNGEFGSRYTRLALVDTGGWTDGNYRAFYSTRASNASVRPRLVITYGTSGSSSSAPAPAPQTAAPAPAPAAAPAPAPAPSTSGSSLRVMQWNIHKTKGTDGACSPERIADTIAAQNVDVVSLNEVNFYSGACAWDFDMSERLQSLVQQKTGRTWYREAVNAGGVGNVLLSRIRPASSSSYHLSYNRGVAQMAIPVNGRNVNVFSTHVEYFESSWRWTQISEAVWWMGNYSEPRIMMGDFNTWPDTGEYNIIAGPYQDAWRAAQSAGTASAYDGNGTTHGDSRFDYLFHSRVSSLALKGVTVPDTNRWGVYPSDHDPVIAVYEVR
jgi:endonuclease/exonuclease/phosphatase family metal-dependent hydrolase